MSYMRGDYYIYRGSGLHISTPDGEATLPMDIFDELVAMRWAQLPVGVRIATEKRAIEKYQGNGGCDALCKKRGAKTMMDLVKEYQPKEKKNAKSK